MGMPYMLGYEPRTWYQNHVYSWQYYGAQTCWNMPRVIVVGMQSFFGKILPVLGLVVTTVPSATILYGIDPSPSIESHSHNFVSTHRSSV